MVEENTRFEPTHKTELSVEKIKQIQKELQGRINPHKNHRLFELNLLKGTIDKAEYHEEKVIRFGEGLDRFKKKQVLMKENCIYISAMNEMNAVKKFLKGTNGSKF